MQMADNDLDFLHSARQPSRDDHAELAKILDEIADKLSKVTISKINDSVTIDNFDIVQAALRNELSRAFKPLYKSIDKLDKPFPEVNIPSSVEVNNLKEFKDSVVEAIAELAKNIKIDVPEANVTVTQPEINIPAPVVNVPTPIVNVPAPIINIPEQMTPVVNIDLSAVIKALEVNLNKLRTNDKGRPLAVRITDGQDWVKELKLLNTQARQQTQFLTDITYVKNAIGQRINPATIEGQELGMLVPEIFDYIALTYVAAGDGIGEIETVTYKVGGAGGTTVAVLTITYNSDDEIATVTRS